MNRQFVFRMQGQETEPKRSMQPDFKLRSIETQRQTTSSSFNSSTMYQRPSQLQLNEYEGENMTSLHAKLHQEADKIRKWKVQTELEIKEKDKKLVSSSTQIETMKKSLLELQLDNERLSSRMQEEIDDRQEVMQKISSTREMCTILKSTATSLEDRLLRCETEKTELKYTGRETSQFLEELSKKFENLQLSTEDNHQQFLLKYDTAIKQKQEREKQFSSKCEQNSVLINALEVDVKEKNVVITELKAALTEKNNALQSLNESLDQLEEKYKLLEKELKIKDDDFKESAVRVLTLQDEKREVEEKLHATEAEAHSLEEAKDKMCCEMTVSLAKYEKDLMCAQENTAKLEKELDETQNKLKDCQTEFQEALTSIENLKSSRDILMVERTELEMKIDLQGFEVSNLRADLDERKEEMHRVDGEMNILLKKLDRENLCKLHFQEIEKDLEAKICSMNLERDEQSKSISELEERIQSQENEIKYKLAEETEKMERHQADIRLKDKELEDGRSQLMSLKEDLVQSKEVIVRKDSEIERLQEEIQEQKAMTEQCQKELKQSTDSFEEFKETYEDERRKTDELSNQLKDMNLEKKEHGKSLTSQQKKLATQTKQIKDFEREVKYLKADLNLEIKKKKETEKTLKSMEDEVTELKQTNDKLYKSTTEYEKEMNILRDECKKDKIASEEAMHKAKEMQEIAKKESENAKALTERQLAEMMGTLDSYKQSSEKILADKDIEVRSLKNKLEAVEAKKLSENDKMKDENDKLSSNIKHLTAEKEDLCKQLMETADENQSLKKKLKDLEKQMEENKNANKSPILASETWKPQLIQQMPPVTPVTPPKQQTAPWTPKTPRTPRTSKTPIQQNRDNQNLKTPQRSILRPNSSISKRRKVAFLPDENQDLPSSSDELMELEVEAESGKNVNSTPVFISRTPKTMAAIDTGLRMTPKRVSTPLNKLMLTSTPRKIIPETPNVGTFTPIPDKSKSIETKKQQSYPRTPNIRNVSAKKTSKFFTTSPKDKASSRTRIKDKTKKEKKDQLSWFDIDSVYGFDPED